nr:hypothetical protein [Hyphomicrobium sp.]
KQMFFNGKWISSALILSAGVMFLSGCGETKSRKGEVSSDAAKATAAGTSDHGGWWCTEHGIPEGICAQCSTQLAADFQKKGDWCKEHNRPESQCFICHPELEAKFAAHYEAKFGSKPPARTE